VRTRAISASIARMRSPAADAAASAALAVARAADACSCAASTAAWLRLTWGASSCSRGLASTRATGRGGTGAACGAADAAGAAGAARATTTRAGSLRAARVTRDGAAGRVTRGAGLALGWVALGVAVGAAATLGKDGGSAAAVETSGGSASKTTVRLRRIGQPALMTTVSTGSSITVVVLMRSTLSLASRPCVTRTRTVPGAMRLSPAVTSALAQSLASVSPSAKFTGTARFNGWPRTTLDRTAPKPSADAAPPLASAAIATRSWNQPMCMP